MTTLLQRLLIETLPKSEKESVLGEFIQTILPAVEREFSVPAMGGTEDKFSKNADQSLMVHVLNGLITAWNLSKELDEELSEEEARLLCLGFTLHDYDKYNHYCPIQPPPELQETDKIVNLCYQLAQKLNFAKFWEDWEDYLLDICFLAQNTQGKWGSNLDSRQWENERTFQIAFPERLRLCELLRFGDIAVHIQDPAEVRFLTSTGQSLQACLDQLEIEKVLVYHRLRDCRGLITNHIHNAVTQFVTEKGWIPIIYFADGVVYLAPETYEVPSLTDIQNTAWQRILKGNFKYNEDGLESYIIRGETGFVRGREGLKAAPLAFELFTPFDLLCQLPKIIKTKINNSKASDRLEARKLSLSQPEKERLNLYADVWADRIAEFITFVQRKFFQEPGKRKLFVNWVLGKLNLEKIFSYEQTQIESGGNNYGWYWVATHFLAENKFDRHPDSEILTKFLNDLGYELADWANKNDYLPEYFSPTHQSFNSYLASYLELSGWEGKNPNFEEELSAYTVAKSPNNWICSLSSGEFVAEEQLVTMVLFQPQLYSNKNVLGGRQIKRGISKIWSLEMLLRQTEWSVPMGKNFEKKRPVFLYIFPAYVYSPQTATAIKILAKQMERISLWDVHKHRDDLQNLPWQGRKPKAGRFDENYVTTEMPFVAIHMMTPPPKGKDDKPTVTESWVEPLFKALALPQLLGVKVVVTPSPEILYSSDKDFLESVKLDGVPDFWTLLGFDSSLRIQDIKPALEKLLVIYSIHLDNRSSKKDARWSALNSTVREVITDVLNVFAIAQQGLRSQKHEPLPEEVKQYWQFADLLAQGDSMKENRLKLTKRLVSEYRYFYQVRISESSHAIL